MVDGADSTGPVDRLHDLLLAMTGRVDDDAVNSARELLGTGQLGAAAELVVGCLLAGRVPVTPSEQYHLRWVLEQARSQRGLVDRLHVLEGIPAEPHRFSEPDMSEGEIAEALRPVTRRLPGLRALWCVSRTTPAGVTYGAVPRHVLLAEVASDSGVTATGYQMIEALRRAGISCSVDVFSTGTDLPDYHRNALAMARQVNLGAAASPHGSNHARTPRRSSGGEQAGAAVSDLPAEPPVRVPPAPPEPPAPAPDLTEPAPSEPAVAETATSGTGPSEVGPSEIETAGAESFGSEPAEYAPDPLQRPESPAAGPTAEPAEPDVVDPARPEVVQQGGENRGTAHQGVASGPSLPVEEPSAPQEPATGQDQQHPGENNPRVPAAVDAKLTDRERNLLRKLHEELAQREQDRPAGSRGAGQEVTEQVRLPAEQAANGSDNAGTGGRPDPRTETMPGTGGFPPIGAAPAQQQPPQAR